MRWNFSNPAPFSAMHPKSHAHAPPQVLVLPTFPGATCSMPPLPSKSPSQQTAPPPIKHTRDQARCQGITLLHRCSHCPLPPPAASTASDHLPSEPLRMMPTSWSMHHLLSLGWLQSPLTSRPAASVSPTTQPLQSRPRPRRFSAQTLHGPQSQDPNVLSNAHPS